MPLDLSPCDVGVPSCQPTFDLTKKQFMPHRNGQRVRNKVKTRQKTQYDENFNQSLEVSIVKWKPQLTYRGDRSSAGNGTNNGISLFQSIENWWNCRKKDVYDTESDDLSCLYNQDDTAGARRASDTVFDIVAPFACPQPAVTAADREMIALNEQKIYQQYYSHPMAPEYLSSSHSPQRGEKLSPFHLQQIRGYPSEATGFIEWKNPCMACNFGQSH